MSLNKIFCLKKAVKSSSYKKREIEEIDYKKFNKLINQNDVIVIDVRSKQEFLEGHLTGAINIPLNEVENKIENKVMDKNAIIIVYCQYGARSKKAQDKLKNMGYKNVYNLKDGIEGF